MFVFSPRFAILVFRFVLLSMTHCLPDIMQPAIVYLWDTIL